MVEAAGVEPASLKPSAQMYYKLSQCCINSLGRSLTNSLHEVGDVYLYWIASPFPQFFARCRRPSPLTSIQSRT